MDNIQNHNNFKLQILNACHRKMNNAGKVKYGIHVCCVEYTSLNFVYNNTYRW
jgi:hypothetical protein